MPVNKQTVFKGGSPQRVDSFLAEEYPEYSRSFFKRLIEEEFVTINGRICQSSAKLKNGDRLDISFVEKEEMLTPQKMDFKVIFEDSSLLVIDKPSGLVVHPACGHKDGTLLNGIVHYLGGGSKKLPRVGLVHRLDKETSGVIVVAKNDRTFKSLSKQFTNRTIKKVYLALVEGVVGEDEASINKPIGRSLLDRKQMAIMSDGRVSETAFKVVKHFKNAALLEVYPKTGRTHQIRVHLASIGHPVAGDSVYNPKSKGYPRLMLHAYKLEFTHPEKHKSAKFCAKPPEDFRKAVKKLGYKL